MFLPVFLLNYVSLPFKSGYQFNMNFRKLLLLRVEGSAFSSSHCFLWY